MTLAAALAAYAPGRARAECTIGLIMKTLPAGDRLALIDAFHDLQISTAGIERALKAENLCFGIGAVARHRRGDCKCSAIV